MLNLKNSQILVTGAAGFIGSTLVEALLEMDCNVLGYDNFSDYYKGKETNVDAFCSSPKFKLIKDDILHFDGLVQATKGVDIIFHIAAQPGVRYSSENPTITNRINIEGTLNVLQASVKNNVKKIVNASSSSVYGNPQYTPVDENHPKMPISIYGVSKLTAENYCRIFHELYDLNTVSLRYHTVYGPKGRPDMAVFKWIDSLFNNKKIIVFGDGNQTRDMTFVNDIVNGTIQAAEYDTVSGDVFNLSSGRTVTMNYILEQLVSLTGINPSIEYQKPRQGDVKDTYGNIEKAKKILNYIPQTSVEDGLRLTVEWYKKYFLIK